jgi:hypothetical protein
MTDKEYRAVVIALTVVAIVLFVAALVTAADTEIDYVPSQVPRYYQSIVPYSGSSYWWPQTRNHGPQGRLSNPNQHGRWLRPAGTLRMDVIRARRTLVIPEGKHVEVWRERRRVNPNVVVNGYRPNNWTYPLYRWRFPVGTVLREKLYDGQDRLFAERQREKLSATEWDGHEEIHHQPPGYSPVTLACADCHSEAGKSAKLVTGHFRGREWYGHLSGDDTVYTFRPVTTRGETKPLFASVVRWVDRRNPPVTLLRGRST